MLIVLIFFGSLIFFFFNDTATTEIYTLSLHDALPISRLPRDERHVPPPVHRAGRLWHGWTHHPAEDERSEEHTSELQSLAYLVCRLLLEKKKKTKQQKSKNKQKKKNKKKQI